jgi:hypothetical protein
MQTISCGPAARAPRIRPEGLRSGCFGTLVGALVGWATSL